MIAKVANLFFDRIIEAVESYGELDMNFYKSKHWPARPNSTARLNLINYTALNQLGDGFEVENIVVTELTDNILKVFNNAEFVIIHQNASKKTFTIIREIMDYLKNQPIRAKIIFGTEGTWANTKEILTEINISDIYKNHTLLRHTAKTDREFYIDESCLALNVREFELGVDTALLSAGKPSSARKLISFVAAPEGRKTKNNKLIYEIKSQIEQQNYDFDVKVLEPPYSSEEYWTTMENSAFFIFTSDSETFSYCLNDAKALGAITFFPTHMYCTKIGNKFVVDNYIDSNIRYSSIDEVIDRINFFIGDPERMAVESHRSRQYILDNHTVSAVKENWKALLSDSNAESRALYIYDRSRDSRTLEDIARYCKSMNAVVAMPYMNLDEISWSDDKFFSTSEGFKFVKYYLSYIGNSLHRGLTLNQNDQFRFGVGAKIPKENLSELVPFISLVKRVNKIDKIVVDDAVRSELLSEAVSMVNDS